MVIHKNFGAPSLDNDFTSLRITSDTWIYIAVHWGCIRLVCQMAIKKSYINTSFFSPSDENHMHMSKQPLDFCVSFSISIYQKSPTLPLDPRPSAPLINTLWLYLISPQRHPSLSVVKQLETAQEGEENMHLREERGRGKKNKHQLKQDDVFSCIPVLNVKIS